MAGFVLDNVHGLKTDSFCKWWMAAIGQKLTLKQVYDIRAGSKNCFSLHKFFVAQSIVT